MQTLLLQPDLTTLLTDAAQMAADDSPGALAALTKLGAEAVGATRCVLYALEGESLCLLAGPETEGLRAAAQRRLEQPRAEEAPTAARTVALTSPQGVAGVWAVTLPDAARQERWPALAQALAPFLLLGLRQRRMRAEVEAARHEVERRMREVGTVYEIGQAMDKVEITRLLDMVTRKAAAVMDAQACSLLIRLPEADSLVIAASHGLPDEVVENTRIFVGQGIAGRVAETGREMLLNSLENDPRFQGKPVQGVPGVSSSICMPMKDENSSVIGVLCIRRRAPSPSFNEEDLRLFSIFATQAALAINNAKLYAKLNHKLQELATLAALTETITSTLDLDQVLNQVADNIVDVVHFDRCRIYLSDMETGRFSPRIVRGFRWTAGAPPEPEITLGEGVIGLVALRQMPLLYSESNPLPAYREYAQALGMDAFYAQPIVARGRCIGVIVVSNTGPQRPITKSSMELLSMFVHQAGIAIENARFLAGQERRYAELTKLYDVSKTLSATSGVQQAAQTVNDMATQITDSQTGLLLLFDASQEALRAMHWRGVTDSLAKRLRSFVAPVPVTSAARALRAPGLLTADEAERLFGPEWRPIFEPFLARHHAAALVPLVVDDTVVGFLLLGKQGAEYGGEELKLIAVASSQAAAVLSNARSYERRTTQKELGLSAVYELMQKVRTATTMDDALDSIMDIVSSLVWSDQAALLTVDDDRQNMTVRAARGPGAPEAIGTKKIALNDPGIAARALAARHALIASEPSGKEGDSQMAIPLIVGDDPIGVLTMESTTPDLYTEESVMMLHLVASQAATIYQEMSSFRALTRYTDNILRSITAGVITVNKNGVVATWNARAEEIARLRQEEVVGLHYTDFIRRLPVDSVLREETMRMVELTARTGKVFTRNQLCYHLPGGDDVYINLSASQLKSESGEYLGVVVVFEDVTKEVQTKEELERVSKLAETGQLAANIAHELRNPLSSIKGAAQLLRHDLPNEYVAQHGEFLDIIVEEVNGLNRMTTEFLEFSRATPSEMQTVSLNVLVSRLLQFMNSYLHSQDVAVRQELNPDVPDVYLDKSQIEQVVKNIVINGVQAMPHGGTLTVATRHLAAQESVELSFSDTGVGITPEKIEKIWTPFFTTKTKGTGLGLAIARKIVETHNGRLTVRSTPGEGSTFTMQVPTNCPPLGMLPQHRPEIADQRSDTPGDIYEALGVHHTE